MESLYAVLAKMAADYLTWFIRREAKMLEMSSESKSYVEKVELIQSSDLSEEEKNEKIIAEYRKRSGGNF